MIELRQAWVYLRGSEAYLIIILGKEMSIGLKIIAFILESSGIYSHIRYDIGGGQLAS
jgi:hypothetical protein